MSICKLLNAKVDDSLELQSLEDLAAVRIEAFFPARFIYQKETVHVNEYTVSYTINAQHSVF